ncbi:hypothetical protein BaRGS_00015795, partial [Batillaria attramentaria]
MACAQGMDVGDSGDDFLESVFLNENRCQDEGYAEGQADGRRKGLEQGFRLGCEKGCEIGAELGFYQGFSEAIRPSVEGLKNKARVLKTLESLQELIQSFPLTDPKHPSLHEEMQTIRAKFKQ